MEKRLGGAYVALVLCAIILVISGLMLYNEYNEQFAYISKVSATPNITPSSVPTETSPSSATPKTSPSIQPNEITNYEDVYDKAYQDAYVTAKEKVQREFDDELYNVAEMGFNMYLSELEFIRGYKYPQKFKELVDKAYEMVKDFNPDSTLNLDQVRLFACNMERTETTITAGQRIPYIIKGEDDKVIFERHIIRIDAEIIEKYDEKRVLSVLIHEMVHASADERFLTEELCESMTTLVTSHIMYDNGYYETQYYTGASVYDINIALKEIQEAGISEEIAAYEYLNKNTNKAFFTNHFGL